MTARQMDTNGWIEIQDNPISKVGVFDYSGYQLPEKLGLDPDKTYKVYRSADALSDEKALKTIRLLPWTDDHPERLLGNSKDGLIPTDHKGIDGVIGERISFDGEFLRANIKVFSEAMAADINSGKKELSLGYKADYILSKGVYNGEPYDVIQTNIRGNHISLVDEGRSGPSVSVLDEKQKEDSLMKEDDKTYDEDPSHEAVETLTLESLASKVDDLGDLIEKFMGASEEVAETVSADGDEDNEKDYIKSEIEENLEEDADATEDESMTKVVGDECKDEDKDDDKKDVMDAANLKKVFLEISQRDKLKAKLSHHIGTFDCSNMTLSEVAKYGVKKLGLKCPRGSESVMLDGYLTAKRVSTPVQSAYAMDTKIKSTSIDSYLNGEK